METHMIKRPPAPAGTPFRDFVQHKAMDMAGRVFDLAMSCVAEARQQGFQPGEYDPGAAATLGLDLPDEADFIEAMMGVLKSQGFVPNTRFRDPGAEKTP